MRRLVIKNDKKQEKKIVYFFDDGIKVSSKITLIDKIKSYFSQCPHLEIEFVVGLKKCLSEKAYKTFMDEYIAYDAKVEKEKIRQADLFNNLFYQDEIIKEKFLLPISIVFRPYALEFDYDSFIQLDETRWLNFYLYNFLPYLRFDFDKKFICFESDTHRFIFNFQLLLANDKYVDKLYKIMLYAVENFNELVVPGLDLQFQTSQPVRVEWSNFISRYVDMLINNDFRMLAEHGLFEFHFRDYCQIEEFFKSSADYFNLNVNLRLTQFEKFLNIWIIRFCNSGYVSEHEQELVVKEREFFYNPTWLYDKIE